MRVIDAPGVDAALSMPSLIDALAAAFRAGIAVPPRHHHSVTRGDAAGTLLLMPAWTGPDALPSYLGTKTLTLFPGNAARQLPTVFGSYSLMDGSTGRPLALMDGGRLTLWRTAAASRGEQTTPSMPAATAFRTRSTTTSAIGEEHPRSARSA